MLLIAAASFLSVLLVWFGYPALIALVAGVIRRRGTRSPAWRPRTTVIIASRDSAEEIRGRVANCLMSEYDPDRLEVVVALDAAGSRASEHTLRFADPRVKVVRGDQPGGKAAALNAAVRAASGEVLVFTDTHQRFAPPAVRRLIESLSEPRVGIVSGCLDLPHREGGGRSLADRYWLMERWLRHRESQVHSTVGVTGAIYAMHRSLWQDLPVGLILDDVYTPMRLVLAGHRVGFRVDAVATDTRVTAPEQEYRRKVRTLTGVLQLCAWLPGILLPLRNPIWLQFVCHKLLRLATPFLLLLFVAAAAVEAISWIRPDVLLAGGASLTLATLVVAGRRAGRMVRELVLLQAAVVVATANGLRGRWDVW